MTRASNQGRAVSQSSASAMIFRSIRCFSDDGVLDVEELDRIVAIALADGVMDEDERKVLKNIILNLTSRDLTPEMWERVEQLVKHYRLDQPD
jgi:uncharacterized membrane protein YebE (DUF533 family)